MMNRQRLISRFWRWRLLWHETCAIWHILAQSERFVGLARWAKHKGLAGPRQAYEDRLEELERRLSWRRARHPMLVSACQFFYIAYGQMTATAPRRTRRRTARRRRWVRK